MKLSPKEELERIKENSKTIDSLYAIINELWRLGLILKDKNRTDYKIIRDVLNNFCRGFFFGDKTTITGYSATGFPLGLNTDHDYKDFKFALRFLRRQILRIILFSK